MMETKEEYKVEEPAAVRLARLMLDWYDERTKLDAKEAEIKALVLELGKTQTIGRARATYNNGRKVYDYREVAEAHAYHADHGGTAEEAERVHEAFLRNGRLEYDYKGICEALGVKDVPYSQAPPTVTLKVLEV